MGNLLDYSDQIEHINFEQLKKLLIPDDNTLIINTMPLDRQQCLLPETINADLETEIINDILEKGISKNKTLVIYGLNHTDKTVFKKAIQLNKLGFGKVKIYLGGMFEWLLLQDVYGKEEFATTGKALDILLFL